MNSFTSRFGILFYADTKQAESGLQRLSGMFSNMHLSLMAMQNISGHAFSAMSDAIIGSVKALVGTAAEMEKTEALFMFAFRDMGEDAHKVFEAAQEAGLRSIQTTKEIIDITKDLKLMGKVNIFDPEMPKLMDSTKTKSLELVDVIGDMASQLQFGTRSAKFGLMALLNGDWNSAKRHLDPIAGVIKEYKAAMQGAGDQQERLRRIAPLLARDFGGAADAMKSTWEFISMQMTDIGEKLLNTFGKPMMNSLKVSLREFQNFFVGNPDGIILKENIHRLDAMKDVFADMGEKLGFAAVFVKDVALGLFEILRTHPGIIKIVAQFAIAATILTGIIATVIGLKVALMALVYAGPMGAIIAALSLGAFLIGKWAVGGEGIIDTFYKFRIVSIGVMEILSTMSGHTAQLSEETVKLANEKGVLGLIIKIGMFAYRVSRVLDGIKDAIMNNIGIIQTAFMPAWEAVDGILASLGMKATTSSDKWHDAGKTIGEVMTAIAVAIGTVVSALAQITAWIVENKPALMVVAGALGVIVAAKTATFGAGVYAGSKLAPILDKGYGEKVEDAFFGGKERKAEAEATSATTTELRQKRQARKEAGSASGTNSVINIHNYVDGEKAALKRYEIAGARGTFNMTQDVE